MSRPPVTAPLALAVALGACGPSHKPMPPQVNVPPQAPPLDIDAGVDAEAPIPPQAPPHETAMIAPVLVGPFDRVD